MAQQLGVPASDIEVAIVASPDGNGVDIVYAVQADSAASAAVMSSQIAAMDLAALLAAMNAELGEAGISDVTIAGISDISSEAGVLPTQSATDGQPAVTGTISEIGRASCRERV